MVAINEGSKYFCLVKEDTFGEEKWREFMNDTPTDKTTPPTSAIQWKDFISTDYDGGSMGSSEDDEGTKWDKSMCRSVIAIDGVKSSESSPTLETGWRDFFFLLSTFQTLHTNSPYTDIRGSEVLVHDNQSSKINSLTQYVGRYDDYEYSIRGTQINTMSVKFGEDALVTLELECTGSKEKLNLLKPQNVFLNLISYPIYNWHLAAVFFSDKPNFHLDLSSSTPIWNQMEQVGCNFNDVEIKYDNKIEDAKGSSPCTVFGGSTSISSKSFIKYTGERTAGMDKGITIDAENKLTTAIWKQRSFGGPGLLEYFRNNKLCIALLFFTGNSETIIITLPNISMTTESPSLEKDATESLTFTAGQGSIIEPHGETINGGCIAYYNSGSGGLNMQGIGFAKVAITQTILTNKQGMKMIIRRNANNGAMWIQEVKEVREYLIPLFDEEVSPGYSCYIIPATEISGNPTETVKGSAFAIDHLTDTEASPKDLTSIFNS